MLLPCYVKALKDLIENDTVFAECSGLRKAILLTASLQACLIREFIGYHGMHNLIDTLVNEFGIDNFGYTAKNEAIEAFRISHRIAFVLAPLLHEKTYVAVKAFFYTKDKKEGDTFFELEFRFDLSGSGSFWGPNRDDKHR